MTHLRAFAHLLGGDVVGQNILFSPPGHSRHDRSASLRFDPDAPEGFLVHSFAGDNPMPIRDYVRDQLGLMPHGRAPVDSLPPTSEANEAGRTERALGLWAEARDPHGTPVEAYLRQRRLALPDAAAGEAIRFHPGCPFSGMRIPAMVCLVRDVLTDQAKAIHRTPLELTGPEVKVSRLGRKGLGPIAGGAIKLTPDEDVTTCLGIGEGVESTLSLCRIPEFGHSPVWSLISAGGAERFPVLSGIECLWIAVDHDEAGLRAARSTARRWQAAGAEVRLTTPSAAGADLNDVTMAMGL